MTYVMLTVVSDQLIKEKLQAQNTKAFLETSDKHNIANPPKIVENVTQSDKLRNEGR